MSRTAWAYLDTRVTLKAKRLMSEATIRRLVDQPVEDILSRLRDPQELHPGPPGVLDLQALERSQLRSLFDDFAVLIRPLRGVDRELLTQWSRHHEFLNLKTLVRGKLRGIGSAELRPRLFDLGHYAVLDYDRLAGADDIAELLRHLADSRCADTARQIRHALAAGEAPFHLDAILDRHYHTLLVAKAAATGSSELRHLAGVLTDARNLVWLLRYRFLYGLSPTETYFVLTPSGALLTRPVLTRLVRLEHLEQVLAALPEPLATPLAGATTATEVEHRLEVRTQSEARAIMPVARSAVARAFAYLILREIDMHRMLAVLRGKALDLNADAVGYAAGLASTGIESGGTHV